VRGPPRGFGLSSGLLLRLVWHVSPGGSDDSTLDGVIQANGGPTEQDVGFEYAGWGRPFGDAESGAQVVADVQASDGCCRRR
jgi:hypothetical protein